MTVLHRETAGGKRSPEFVSWMNMVQRCSNPARSDYARYGARGITVCARWLESFEAFLSDVGRKPSAKHSLERIDNTRGYEPENVRWATPSEQARNRRSSRLIEAFGETKTLVEWSEKTGLDRTCILRRLQLGWDAERALSTPSAGRPNV